MSDIWKGKWQEFNPESENGSSDERTQSVTGTDV